MEMFLKFKFQSIKKEKSIKIKAIDAVLSLMADDKDIQEYSNKDLVIQKLQATVDLTSKADMGEDLNEIPQDYQNIDILKNSDD